MKRSLAVLFAAVLFALQGAAASVAQETPDDIMFANKVLMPISMHDVDLLEKLADEIVASKARMPDGKWQIDAFNNAFSLFLGPDRETQLAHLEETFKKWKAAYPKSRIAPVAHAYVLFKNAFAIRGSRFASDVWEEDWAPFNDNLKRALVILEESKDTAQSNPRWYSTMIGVKGALGLPKPVLLATAREGLAKEPAHFQTYLNTLVYLYPMWDGSVAHVRAWIEEAASLSKASEGDSMYARLYWDVMGSADAARIVGATFDWPRMHKAMDDLVGRYPTIENQVKALDISCKSGDAKAVLRRYEPIARDVGPKMEKKVDPARYCRWPAQAAQRPVIDPDNLPARDKPQRTRTN